MNKKKKKKGIKLHHVIIAFISIYIFMIAINQNKLKRELSLKEKEVQNDVNELQEGIEDLNKQLEKKGSIEFLENTAREELGMVKPNEIIYIDRGRYQNSIFDFFNKPSD